MIQERAAVSEPPPVTFKDLKEWASKYSPPDSPLREAFLAEPDDLPRELGLPKLEVFNRWPGERSHIIV
jgi:hypothetical protein